jgi:hypothetical protein
MNTASEITMLVDELAAHWTDSALEILRAAGVRKMSVDMELEAWRTLKRVLHRELRWQRAFRFSTLVSLSTLREQVLRQAAHLVAEEFEPAALSYEFERRVRRAAADQRSSEIERRLYARMTGQPTLHAAFKPPTRTDFTPRLRISTVGA